MAILSDAEAVETAAEFVELYAPNAAVGDGFISLSIGTRYRVTFTAIGAALVRDRNAGLDWSAVRRLKMMDLSSC
jgi:hypothetical protein